MGRMKDSTEFVPVLHVRAATFDPHALLSAHPELKPYAVWRAGDPASRQRTHSDSGFKLDLGGTGSEWSTVVRRCIAKIHAAAPALRKARKDGARITLDIGVMPDGQRRLIETAFSPDDLAVLSKAGVCLCVSSYLGLVRAASRRSRRKTGASRIDR